MKRRLVNTADWSWSYEQYLLELFRQECEKRQQNRIARNLRDSKLPSSKRLKTLTQNGCRPGPAVLQVLIDCRGCETLCQNCNS